MKNFKQISISVLLVVSLFSQTAGVVLAQYDDGYGTSYGSTDYGYGTSYGSTEGYGTSYGSTGYGTSYGSTEGYGTSYGSTGYGTSYGSTGYGTSYVSTEGYGTSYGTVGTSYSTSPYTITSYTAAPYTTTSYTTSPYTTTSYSYGSTWTNTPVVTSPVITTVTCPTGSVLTNGQCLNTVTGTIITTTTCPTGTVLSGTNCINTVTGTIVTVVTCPTGSTLTNGQCVNTVTGVVVTNINCPTGTVLTNGQCVNTITGTTVTNINCPSGSILTNGQCVNTITPPVTTVTNCPIGTTYVNGECQRVITPPVVTYQTCWDGSVIPGTTACPQQLKTCPNGTRISFYDICAAPVTVVKFNNVVTSVVTEITNVSGRCNGIGLIANGAPSTGWFEYGETPKLGRTTGSAAIGTYTTAPFSNVLANLKPTTTYYCRAVMQNKYGVVKGEIVSFTTKAKKAVYVKPVTTKTPVKTVTKKPVKNAVTCSDGTTVSVKTPSSAVTLNKGEKLVALQIEKTEGKLSANGVVTYKMSYKNLSDSRIKDVVAKVTLPQEIKLMNSSAGNYDEGTNMITLNQDTLDPYTEGVVTFTGKIRDNAQLGKSIVSTAYVVYTVPGTQVQDEVTAYVVGSIVPEVDIAKVDTGAKKVVGQSAERGFMPNSLIEWLALLAIFFILFILGRSIYASYKEEGNGGHH